MIDPLYLHHPNNIIMTSHEREGHNWQNISFHTNIWSCKKYIPSHKYLILQKGSNVVHDAALLPPLHPRGVLHLWKGLLPSSCRGFGEYIMFSIFEYMYLSKEKAYKYRTNIGTVFGTIIRIFVTLCFWVLCSINLFGVWEFFELFISSIAFLLFGPVS